MDSPPPVPSLPPPLPARFGVGDEFQRQMLAELRKLRRSSQVASIVCLAAAACLAVLLLWRLPPPRPRLARSAEPAQADSWSEVRSAMEHFEYDRAAGISQRIVDRNPNDYYGYEVLGNIAMVTGRIKDAEHAYARAETLFPSENNAKMLVTIRKRLARDAAGAPLPSPKP